MSHSAKIGLVVVNMLNLSAQLLVAFQVNHLKDDHKVDMHNDCTFNHRYVKPNPSWECHLDAYGTSHWHQYID
jgi:hypothetical protein